MKHYRGFDPIASLSDPAKRTRCQAWLDAIKGHPSVKATLADEDKLCGSYKRYADDVCQSQVAVAIKKGTQLP